MVKEYATILEHGTGEIVEKKSRFIGYVRHVETEEEALSFVNEIKKKHYDARHNCYAYTIGEEQPLLRFSDDGEPGGTAGKPILEVITGKKLCNVCIVVTRYFGGTLLGTGGLVRAYTDASKEALKNCETKLMQRLIPADITTTYTDMGKIQYILGQENISIENSLYAEDVEFTILFQENKEKELIKKITEGTNARAKISVIERLYFVDKEKSD